MPVFTRIRMLRKANRLTQKEAAERLGLSRAAYIRYETGKRPLPVTVLIALADLYCVRTDYLLERTDNPNPPR